MASRFCLVSWTHIRWNRTTSKILMDADSQIHEITDSFHDLMGEIAGFATIGSDINILPDFIFVQ